MPEQVQSKHNQQAQEKAEMDKLAEADAVRQEEIRSQAEETISDLDTLLDEIDDLLEVNAEDMVKAYIQKGGE